MRTLMQSKESLAKRPYSVGYSSTMGYLYKTLFKIIKSFVIKLLSSKTEAKYVNHLMKHTVKKSQRFSNAKRFIY